MEVSPSMSNMFYHHQQQQQRLASAYLERMAFPLGYPQYPMYPSYRADDYDRRPAMVSSRFDRLGVDYPVEAPRPRSGSLGSTGSSLRDGYSPSFDSVTGANSVSDSVSSRDSPFSFTSSSPSPSPLLPPTPASDSSKLRRVLMGTLSSPYSVLFRRECPSPRDAVVDHHLVTPPSQRKRKYDSIQTTPMDLSCKKACTSPSRWQCSTRSVALRVTPATTSVTPVEDAGHPSILKAILCGHHADVDRLVNSDAATSTTTITTSSTTHSAMTPAGRNSPCRTANANSCSTASATLPVTLAKKNLLPVSARVLDWLLRIVRFARALPQFATLSHHDKVTLLLNSWPRILLLYMAETDFEFAVTVAPCGGATGDKSNTSLSATPMSMDASSVECRIPTMSSVEDIQRFIRKSQTLNLDSTEYEYMRMATLFHRGEMVFRIRIQVIDSFSFSCSFYTVYRANHTRDGLAHL